MFDIYFKRGCVKLRECPNNNPIPEGKEMNRNNKWLLWVRMGVFLIASVFSIQGAFADSGAGAKKGDQVTLNYTGTFNDGTVFDSSDKHDTPLMFEVGSGQVITGFDNAVMGMKKGEEKSFTLQPSEAYGEHDPKMIQKVPRSELPQNREPKAGMMLIVGTPQGGQIPATITEVTDQEITLDMNHPLAGKVLNFKIKLVEVAH